MCAAVYRQRHLVKATEVTTGSAESNGSLLPGLGWRDSLHVTCGLTACTPGSAPLRAQRSVTNMGKLYLLLTYYCHLCFSLAATADKKSAKYNSLSSTQKFSCGCTNSWPLSRRCLPFRQRDWQEYNKAIRTADPRKTKFLHQRISMVVQSYGTVSC